MTNQSMFCASGRLISLAVGVFTLSFASPILAQTTEKTTHCGCNIRTLTVVGRGSESVATNISKIQLGVEFQAKTANQAQQEVAKRSDSVVKLLRSRSVEKLQTTGIRLNPVYSYENNIQRLTGYTATNTVSFQIATEKAGGMMDDAVSAGATRIDSISFIAPETAISNAQQQALKEASQDAQKQADTVLASLGLTRKDVVNISINSANPPQPVNYALDTFAKTQSINTPVIGGEQQVEATVTLQISY
ncbi:MAG TPA: SIMPL domain-containing protein [Allocoleopsis sp.]